MRITFFALWLAALSIATPAMAAKVQHIKTSAPIIQGALDQSVIDDVVKQHLAQIQYCYTKELNKNPGLYGKIVIKFVIAKDGSVSSAKTNSSSMNNPIVENCICQRFMRFQFPQPKGGGIVIVTYPFQFSGGGESSAEESVSSDGQPSSGVELEGSFTGGSIGSSPAPAASSNTSPSQSPSRTEADRASCINQQFDCNDRCGDYGSRQCYQDCITDFELCLEMCPDCWEKVNAENHKYIDFNLD